MKREWFEILYEIPFKILAQYYWIVWICVKNTHNLALYRFPAFYDAHRMALSIKRKQEKNANECNSQAKALVNYFPLNE